MIQLENFQLLHAVLIINAKRYIFSILMYGLNELGMHMKYDDDYNIRRKKITKTKTTTTIAIIE